MDGKKNFKIILSEIAKSDIREIIQWYDKKKNGFGE
jgi:hypothetical protein